MEKKQPVPLLRLEHSGKVVPLSDTTRDGSLLRSSAFHNAPDPDVFFASTQHKEVLEGTLQALRNRQGLVLLMGGIGTGKTTLLTHLRKRYARDFLVGQISNPFLTPAEFEAQILHQLKIKETPTRGKDFYHILGDFLRQAHAQSTNVVLFLDEGHLISLDIFDRILILSNFQADGRNLLQIVLSGQPELENILLLPRFASLNQRTRTRFCLSGLDREETGQYIRYRLQLFGSELQFKEDALEEIWALSNGIPRLINHICSRVLEASGTGGRQAVGRKEVKRAVQDRFFLPLLPRRITLVGWKRTTCCLVGAWVLALLLVVLAAPRLTSILAPERGIDQSAPFESELHSAPEAGKEQIWPVQPGPKQPQGPQEPALSGSGQGGKIKTRAATPRTTTQSPAQAVPARISDQVKIDAIVWNTTPAKRWVVVGGRFLREGDQAGPLKVLHIDKTRVEFTQDGFVFSKNIEHQ